MKVLKVGDAESGKRAYNGCNKGRGDCKIKGVFQSCERSCVAEKLFIPMEREGIEMVEGACAVEREDYDNENRRVEQEKYERYIYS